MKAGAALALVLLTAGAPAARAQAVLHEEERTPYASGQHWAIELRFGLYRPSVDSEFKGTANPHEAFFGNKRRLMFQLEGDYQFFNRFGTAAVALSAGYFRETAKAFVEGGDGTERSGDSTALTLYPLSAGLVYRFDIPVRRAGIPLVPYAKVGLTYTIWSISNGNGDVATFDTGGRGRGGTPGWYGGVGISFLLNFLDPTAARTFDSDSGVNRTYLFFELDHIDGSGLGRKNVLHVGDDTWFAGLMFEF